MPSLLTTLRQRNPKLYRFGAICWAGAACCLLLRFVSKAEVMGVNAWIKPLKFFLSVAIAVWTLGWLLHWLENQRALRRYTTMTLWTLGIELVIITGQAARGRLSHFNIATWWEMGLFWIMGLAITVFTIWTLVIAIQFLKQKGGIVSPAYSLGIGLGMLCFVLFSFEGGVMGYLLKHSVGGDDGGAGLPLFNWSSHYGDLRAAHFLGIHGLQVLPFAGWLLGSRKRWMWVTAFVYVGICLAVLIRSAMALPVW